MPKQPNTTKVPPVISKRRTRPLGPFSYLLMCTLSRLPKAHSYGAVLEQQLSEQYHELIDLAQVYVALGRLEGKDFIVGSDQMAPTGFKHTVTVYTITAEGRAALKHAARFYKMLAAAAPD